MSPWLYSIFVSMLSLFCQIHLVSSFRVVTVVVRRQQPLSSPSRVASSSLFGSTATTTASSRNVIPTTTTTTTTRLFSSSSSSTTTKPTTESSSSSSSHPAHINHRGNEHPKHPRMTKRDQILKVPQVILKRTNQSKAFRNGNQLVFTRAIQRIEHAPENNNNNNILEQGTLVQVFVEDQNKNDNKNNKNAVVVQPIGWGVYNPDSLYKVRMLCHIQVQPILYHDVACACETPEEALDLLLRNHIQQAVRVRESLGLFQKTTTTDTFRLVHGEGDYLSGLAVDLIGISENNGNAVAVVMSSAAWCEIYKDRIVHILQDVLGKDSYNIVWKTTPSRLNQDGYHLLTKEDVEHDEYHEQNDDDTDDNNDDHSPPVLSRENGILYETHPMAVGQKTGVYCDQRENRLWLAQNYITDQSRVLDLCCYHGGFSLNAAIHGKAKTVIGVDSSAVAIHAAQQNAKLNQHQLISSISNDQQQQQQQVSFIQADITQYLQNYNTDDDKQLFDVVILDPPKLAPTTKVLDKARRKYHALNRDAIKVINEQKGGLLLTCTCSAAMTQDPQQAFVKLVQAAAMSAGRQVTLLSTRGAAACHTTSPISYPAGAYLTAALFYVHRKETE